MPLELVWDRFLKGHEKHYSLYIHPHHPLWVYTKENTLTDIFINKQIPGKQVFWGDISVVDAERRLLAWALLDPLNEFFVLLSEACMPIRGFQYMYDFLMRAEHSFVESYYDDGPHGVGRYLDGMMPEVPRSNFRKGSQWFAMDRRHAAAVLADTLYYSKFRAFCKPGKENNNCYSDEHYIQTYLHMMDPGGIANYSVTFVDWTQGGTHPRLFDKRDLTPGKIKRIQGLDRLSDTLTPIAKVRHKGQWCYWNGEQRPCFLFMRKVHADVVDAVMELPEDILGY